MKLLLTQLFTVFLLTGQVSCNRQSLNNSGNNVLPNIILLMNDDMGYECLSCNGSTSYNTPELDKLTAEGMRFTNCFSQPLCTPSRVKIMTGKYNCNNYIDFGFLDPTQKTFGNLLQDAGYKTLVAGKWQLNGVNTNEPGCDDVNRPYQFGFDEYCLWWFTSKGPRYANPAIVANSKSIETTIDDYGPDVVSDYILDFIERNNPDVSGKPFFVYYPMILVHSPFKPTPDSPEWKDPERRNETDTRYFKDMVEYTDKIVGKLNNKLEELGLKDNTIFIFTGDNGTNTDIVSQTTEGPYPGGKGTLKDNGNHVPLVINWPDGGIKNSTNSELVEFSDFLPTFAEAVGVNIPEDIDGKSFYNLIANKEYTPRESIFIHYWSRPQELSNRAGCFARTEEYKLYSTGEFFNMKTDKWEVSPLDVSLLNEEQKEIHDMLKSKIDAENVWNFSTPHRSIN